MATKKTLSERLQSLRDDTFSEIRKQMKRIGRTIGKDADDIEFFSYKDAVDEEIIGITKDGLLITISGAEVAMEDCAIELGNFNELAEDLKIID